MSRFFDRLLGREVPERRRRRVRAGDSIERGVGELQELKEALRRYAHEAARSAASRDGMRELEELKRQLRERAAVLAERERELDERERELEQLARQLRGSRRRRRSPRSQRGPSGEPVDSEG